MIEPSHGQILLSLNIFYLFWMSPPFLFAKVSPFFSLILCILRCDKVARQVNMTFAYTSLFKCSYRDTKSETERKSNVICCLFIHS